MSVTPISSLSMYRGAIGFLVAGVVRGKTSSRMAAEPLFKFGLVADVQYADKDDLVKPAKREDGTQRVMQYRSALDRFRTAIDSFNSEDIGFAVQLGDIIDGNLTEESSFQDLRTALDVAQAVDQPLYHILGNHCRRVAMRDLLPTLGLERAYYSLKVHERWKLIFLNGADVQREAVDATHSDRVLVDELCEKYASKNVPWAAGIGESQMDWFSAELEDCSQNAMRAIVFCHYPTLEAASRPSHTLINGPQVLEKLDEYKHVVAAWFAGHDHLGGYATATQVHHVTFQAVVESPEDKAHAIVSVLDDDTVVIRGSGSVPSRSLEQLTLSQ